MLAGAIVGVACLSAPITSEHGLVKSQHMALAPPGPNVTAATTGTGRVRSSAVIADTCSLSDLPSLPAFSTCFEGLRAVLPSKHVRMPGWSRQESSWGR